MNGPDALPVPEFVDIDDTKIATYVVDADVEPIGDVVLCHGTPWSAAVWAPIVRTLRTKYRVFLWDMPGYGASIGEAEHEVDLISQRRRLAALLEYWGLDRPHVVAHDIGGAVALGAHLLEGCDYSSLYLLDIVTLDPWGSPFFRLVAQNESVFSAIPSALHKALVREYIAGATNGGLDSAAIDQLVEPWCTEYGQNAFYRQIARLTPDHTRPIVAELHRLRCPVRVGWGERDPWIPAEQAIELASLLPKPVEVDRFPDAGHLVPLEATDSLNAKVLEWLRG